HPDLADLPGYLAYAVILADDTESLMPSRLAPGRPPVPPGEVVRHRLGEVPERLLLHVHRPGAQPVAEGAGMGELAALLGEPGSGPAARTPKRLMFDGEVPHEPGVRAVQKHLLLLLRRGVHPNPRHGTIVAAQ